MKSNKKKGFTLIELLVVVAILGILLLIAMPKFTDYIQDSKVAHIKSDIKSYETMVDLESFENANVDSEWDLVSLDNMNEYRDSNALYSKSGLVKSSKILEGKFSKIKREDFSLNSSLKGDFIFNSGGEVYYYESAESTGNTEIPEEEVVNPDYVWVEESWGNGYLVPGEKKGYYKYIGSESVIEIPNSINGHELTSYYKMFSNTSASVSKVISKNSRVTNMSSMFESATGEVLDVSELESSNVENMGSMFYMAGFEEINLVGLDTSSAKTMEGMFGDTVATKLVGLDGFSTSNVESMAGMFSNSHALELNLSSFDTSKTTSMNRDYYFVSGDGSGSHGSSIFENSKADKIILGSNFKGENLTSFSNMFYNSNATEIEGLENLNTANSTQFISMFENSKVIVLDISNFDLSNAIPYNDVLYPLSRMLYSDVISEVDLNIDSYNSIVYSGYYINSEITYSIIGNNTSLSIF